MHAATKAKVIGSALRGTDRHMCWPAHPVIEQYIVDDVHFMPGTHQQALHYSGVRVLVCEEGPKAVYRPSA